MKKIVAVAAFFMTMGTITFAQNGDLRLGFQVSPTISFMSTDDNNVNGNGPNLGLKLGLTGEIYFRENYAFNIGLGFSFNSGGTLRHDEGGGIWLDGDTELPSGVGGVFPPGTDLKYGIQYVEIPFGLKFRTNEIGYLRYYAEVPTFTLGFRSQSRGDIEFQGINEDNIDIRKEVSALALSWGVGGGIEYNVSSGTSLVAGLAYQRIFTDVTKDYDAVDSKAAINHIVVRLGVLF